MRILVRGCCAALLVATSGDHGLAAEQSCERLAALRQKLLQDMRKRRVLPAVETMLSYYAKGKPVEAPRDRHARRLLEAR